MELECVVQKYAWGKPGLASAVADLLTASEPDFSANPATPYAELWMGTHPNGPSKLYKSEETLKEHILQHPHKLGERSRAEFGDALPFLFKVLSVDKALSIQAHPDKSLAKKLNAAQPDIYKDDNHKPGMAIALTDFEGLCGFRPLAEIQEFLRTTEELCNVIGEERKADLLAATDASYDKQLKAAFAALMNCSFDVILENLNKLEARVKAKPAKDAMDGLFLRLLGQYPSDVGCLVIFFVNHVRLRPGQAMFLGAGLVHAYLSGDCIECMACSDNVVRAGLTPKLIDRETLIDMLRYECVGPEAVKFVPEDKGDGVVVYNPPVPDFAVDKLEVKAELTVPAKDSASIMIVTKGEGMYDTNKGRSGELKKGRILFLASEEEIKVTRCGSGTDPLLIFQAYC